MARHHGKFYIASTGSKPGQKQYYKPVYSASNWNEFVIANAKGKLLQVCCGASFEGSVRVDRDRGAPSVNVLADMLRLPFANNSFDTIACDPIYDINYLKRISLQRELFRVARQLVIFKAPWVLRGAGWKPREPVMGIFTHTCGNVSILSVLEALPQEDFLFREGSD